MIPIRFYLTLDDSEVDNDFAMKIFYSLTNSVGSELSTLTEKVGHNILRNGQYIPKVIQDSHNFFKKYKGTWKHPKRQEEETKM